jgi:hypothetical protein
MTEIGKALPCVAFWIFASVFVYSGFQYDVAKVKSEECVKEITND